MNFLDVKELAKDHRIFHAVLLTVLPVFAVAAQQQGARDASAASQKVNGTVNVDDQIKKLESGNIDPVGLHRLTGKGSEKAIPALEKQFSLAANTLDKAKSAAVLVRLRAPRKEYWRYLDGVCRPIAQSTAPGPINFDKDGKETGVSPAFLDWVTMTKQDPAIAVQNATLVFPVLISYLGETGDPSFVPLLRTALSSPNFLIVTKASAALARLHSEDSLPWIVDAVERAPSKVAGAVAESLVQFSAPEAQSVVNRYVSKDRQDRLRANSEADGNEPQ
jgi:hypothetical protein